MFGYQLAELPKDQRAFVATPEKALLDLIYLQTGGDSPDYLSELRLQNLDRLNLEELRRYADLTGSHKLRRAIAVVMDLAHAEADEYKAL